MRDQEFVVVLNPTGKVKYYYDEDTLERVDTAPMNPQDFQVQIEFEEDGGAENG